MDRLRCLLLCSLLLGIASSSAAAAENEEGMAVPQLIRLPWQNDGVTECEESYGIFPCSLSLGGNLFLLIVYGFCLLKSAQFLSEGSERLLTVLNPGLIGGLLLPVLGALPDALLILVSGLSASKAEAQSQVLVGMGLLAGSTVMLLTVLWGSCLLLGRCDLVPTQHGVLVAKDKTLTKGYSLTGTGVTTDQQTRVASWIMIGTVIPYALAQSPVIFGWSAHVGNVMVLVGCVVSIVGLGSYCTYQVAFPWIQQRWIYRAKRRFHRTQALHNMTLFAHNKAWGGLILHDGSVNDDALRKLFDLFDANHDGLLCEEELRCLIMGLSLTKTDKIPDPEEISTWMSDFDRIQVDGNISNEEFCRGTKKWVRSFENSELRKSYRKSQSQNGDGDAYSDHPHLFWKSHQDAAEQSLQALLSEQDGESDSESEPNSPTKAQIIGISIFYLVIGALIAGIVADPLVEAIGNFSASTGISPFFISFVATPLATNSSEAISSLFFAMKKKKKNISMTYSQIYGGVTMNNTLCLAIFLAIVYYRGLVWDFSSEVLVIFLATAAIGAISSARITFPTWMSIIALALYPASIALVAVLDYVYGWQ